jgi:hypothetical protein
MTTDIYQAITESTCGEACWQAREDICRCSCGGKNHACLRGQDQRPERTRKLNGFMYQLVAVEAPGASCIAVGERPLTDLARTVMTAASEGGLWPRYKYASTPGYPVKIKTASESEVARWPELAAFRDGTAWGLDFVPWRPATVWVRCDMAHLASEGR